MNATTCEIQCDDSGWYIVATDEGIVADGLITCGDAVEEANAQGLTILNMDDVERWMQPPGDWGIDEPTVYDEYADLYRDGTDYHVFGEE